MWGFFGGNSGEIIFVFSEKVIRGKKGNCGEKIKVTVGNGGNGGEYTEVTVGKTNNVGNRGDPGG